MYQLGVDTGGTFTDFVAFDAAAGETITFKRPSSPDHPAEVVAEGLVYLERHHGVAPERIARLVFGTTVATNALLERKGARVGLLTTEGARDTLEIQRMWRQRLFDLYLRKPEPFVARRDRFEVAERVSADGAPVVPLSQEAAAALAERVGGHYEAIAVCLLFSFLTPEHERQLRDAIHASTPEAFVTLSSDVSPEFREYERTSTTVMNAYVMPKIDRLMEQLGQLMREAGYPGPIGIMQSNGGFMTVETARRFPVNTLLSGPAGGVVGAMEVARKAGLDNVIAMDMGGTSLDVSVMTDGALDLAPESEMAGFPVRVPQVNVHTIGAGGGSIARMVQGVLKVGPDSAGADPGPACYGRGGDAPTSTDAAATLGYIDPQFFAGGAVALDLDAGQRVIAETLAEPLQTDAAGAAFAVVRVQVANMVNGIRAVTVERGQDPRAFALLSFGGAGALYAGFVAEELGIERIIVPINAGVLSAFGMLLSDVKHTKTTSRLMAAEEGAGDAVEDLFAQLESDLKQMLLGEGVSAAGISMERSCEARYRGQAYEVGVPTEAGTSVAALVERFHKAHARLYGHASRGEPVEFVNFRVVAHGETEKARIAAAGDPGGATPLPPPACHRSAYFGPAFGWRRCPVHDRARLRPGMEATGPLLVADDNATTVVLPEHRVHVDAFGNLIITVSQQG